MMHRRVYCHYILQLSIFVRYTLCYTPTLTAQHKVNKPYPIEIYPHNLVVNHNIITINDIVRLYFMLYLEYILCLKMCIDYVLKRSAKQKCCSIVLQYVTFC